MSARNKDYHIFTMRLPKVLHGQIKKIAEEEGVPLSSLLIRYIYRGMKASMLIDRALDAAVAKIANQEATSLLTLLGEIKDKGEDS